ncbi:choice-of-anchor G family protein [Homoserinibacter sp. GY 40078]|uniref:choice-of-anchor G family protein n=1 Tax=Homoserinibacter sp. GY 40078 TaxID=2603275 RepID=UPI00164F8454|nr:choice-of-anchor G family protein [Homoserinibacter sp. GY 40078]
MARGDRRARTGIAVTSSAVFAVLLVGTTVNASAAAWVDEEWDTADVAALDCSASATMDSVAWGRVLTGAVSGASLDPIASTDGITVTNVAPATTSTGTSQAAPVTSLGSDAWSAALGLSALSSLDLGAGVVLPLDAGTGSYTQYGRATSNGIAIGASGAVTSQAGGLVSLDTPTASTPRLGTLRLSEVLDAVLPGLGTPVSRLSDVDLEIGAVGSVAELDGCEVAWNEASLSTHLDRDYLASALDLGLTSDLASGLGTSTDATLAGLQTTLNSTLNASVSASVVSSVASLLTTAFAGIAGVTVDPDAVTVTVAGTIDLTSVRALITNDISDGVVTINLSTGRITADLAALVGEAYADSDGLNGRAPNTSVLTPAVLNALMARLSTVLGNFVTNTLQPAVATAILNTAITVRVVALLDATVTVIVPVTVPQVLRVDSLFSGTIGGFTGASGYPAPTVSTSVTLVPGQTGALLTALNTLLSTVTTPIINAVQNTVRPAIGGIVVTPILTSLSASTTAALATLTGSTIPAFITALEPVLDQLALLVKVTLNAQPDQTGSVGPPITALSGRYMVSALHVGAVNGPTSLLGLWAASSAVGPQTLR